MSSRDQAQHGTLRASGASGSRRNRLVVMGAASLLCISNVIMGSDVFKHFLPQQDPQISPPVENRQRNTSNLGNETENDQDMWMKLLNDAGLDDVDNSTLSQLPRWNDATKVFGSSSDPVIYGKDACQSFRDTIPQKDRWLAVAGMFNTGTNLLAEYLRNNCRVPGSNGTSAGVLWQVPWGKHMLPSHKWNNTQNSYYKYNKTAVLPVVLVRDPYQWMQSMCRHPYAAIWEHGPERCPNLISNDNKSNTPFGSPIPARVRYPSNNITFDFPSLAHVWSEYYQQYEKVDYPRLFVKYEDMLLYPKKLTAQLCECVGGEVNTSAFSLIADNVKHGHSDHGKQEKDGFMTAIVKNSDPTRRVKGLTLQDLQYSYTALDAEMMNLFGYTSPTMNDLVWVRLKTRLSLL